MTTKTLRRSTKNNQHEIRSDESLNKAQKRDAVAPPSVQSKPRITCPSKTNFTLIAANVIGPVLKLSPSRERKTHIGAHAISCSANRFKRLLCPARSKTVLGCAARLEQHEEDSWNNQASRHSTTCPKFFLSQEMKIDHSTRNSACQRVQKDVATPLNSKTTDQTVQLENQTRAIFKKPSANGPTMHPRATDRVFPAQ